MKIRWGHKDGGPKSKVRMWGIESKLFGSVLVLRFENGSREAYHSHAFDAVSWLLSGKLLEDVVGGTFERYEPSVKPIVTARERFHRVVSLGTSYAITFRGRWASTWLDHDIRAGETLMLTHGRRIVGRVEG